MCCLVQWVGLRFSAEEVAGVKRDTGVKRDKKPMYWLREMRGERNLTEPSCSKIAARSQRTPVGCRESLTGYPCPVLEMSVSSASEEAGPQNLLK